MENRWHEIVQFWQRQSPYWLLPGFVVGLIIGLLIGWSANLDNWFLDGFWAEGLGIVITVLLIERVQAWRNREEYKKQLVRQARSRSNDIAISAVDELRGNGWLVGEKVP